MPEDDADELHHPDLLFFLGEELPQQASSSTSSPPSSFKQGRRPRASPSPPCRLGALAGILLDAGECTPSLIRPHCLRFEAKNSPRAQITIDDLELRNPNACEI